MELDRNRFATYRLDTAHGVLELEWTDASAEMTDEDFRAGIERLAKLAEEHAAPNVLVDVTAFRHTPAEDFGPWRDANIIPKYNAAGVTKFAFLVPAGGAAASAPAPEGPAAFPSGYFDSREAIDRWFASRGERS